MVVHLRRSKTDQGGAREQRGVPMGQHPETCPVRTLRNWLATIGISEGPVFRWINRHGHLAEIRLSEKAAALIVKRPFRLAGLDPDRYAGHSLRSGLATSAAEGDAPERSIMKQTGHRSERTVAMHRRPKHM